MNTQRPSSEAIEIIAAPRIAQPIDSIDKPSEVNPSMVNMSEPICEDSQATKSNKAPLITNEIKPNVRMYSGNAKT